MLLWPCLGPLKLPIKVEWHSISEVWEGILPLARERGLSVYDAAYLDLALKMEIPLATLDEALRRAAEDCGVKIL